MQLATDECMFERCAPYSRDVDKTSLRGGQQKQRWGGWGAQMPWQRGGAGDQDYLAAWALVVGPVVAAFRPEVVLVSAGFDAAEGDPLGGCRLTPHGYARLTVRPSAPC